MSTAGIVGLGLIGGSLARDLAAAGWRVQGTDRDAATERAARESGVLAGPIQPGEVDVLVLAVPVRAAPGWLRALAADFAADGPGHGAILTDAGSTKRSVLAAAAAAGLGRRFVGSHPMAGSHRSGWDAARAGLFDGATVWLCAGAAGPPAVEGVASLWRAVGGRPRSIDAAAHDRLLARTSHLPQAAASAVAMALAAAGVPADAMGPGGRDVTRLAGSDPANWTDILLDNADEVGPALGSLMETLTALRDAVAAADPAAVAALLAAARSWRYAGSDDSPAAGASASTAAADRDADDGHSTPRIRGAVGGKNVSSR